MRKNLTEIVFILDRSGSMSGLEPVSYTHLDVYKRQYYISVNSEYQFLPEFIEDKGIAILGDIGTVLKDLRKAKEESAFV